MAYKSFLLIKRIAIKSGNYTSLIKTGMVEITIWFIHSIHSLHTFLLLAVCQAFLQELEDAQQYRTLGLKHNSNIGHSQEVLRNNV